MQIQKFMYKPAFVEAVLVNDTNMAEVAAWCGGSIQTAPPREGKDVLGLYIKVDVQRPMSNRQTQAFSGDWVVLTQFQGYKVFTPKAFHGAFMSVTEDAEERPNPVVVYNAG